MPRQIPLSLVTNFENEIKKASELVIKFESARVILSTSKNSIHVSKIEMLYELAFLRVFLAWESFLEQSFLRYLCGYHHNGGQENIKLPNYFNAISNAETSVLGRNNYVLWHNPNRVIGRAQRYFTGSKHELIIASNLGRLEIFASVRHRIAHAQQHAKREFDRGTMALAGKRYRQSRPGKFLRDTIVTQGVQKKWFELILRELSGLARQIGT